MEIWTCVNPACRFALVAGAMSGIPRECPKCKGQAWDIEETDPRYCRVRGAVQGHDWNEGETEDGLPVLEGDQYCRACGARPLVDGVLN